MGMRQVFTCDGPHCESGVDAKYAKGWIKVGDLDVLTSADTTEDTSYAVRNIDSEVFCSVDCLLDRIGDVANGTPKR